MFKPPMPSPTPRAPLFSSPRALLAAQIAAVVVSAVILWSSFPPAMPGSDGAWFALVPLLLVVRHAAPRRAFRLGFLGGGVFWLLSLTWLWQLIHNNGPWPLVLLGYIGLSAYCALYTALFALGVAFTWQWVHRQETLPKRMLAAILVEPLLWVGGEYVRCTFLTGFAWNALGVTQQDSLPILQVSALGGVYAVSALLVLVNGSVTGLCERIYATVRNRTYGEAMIGGRLRTLETIVPLLLLALAWQYGYRRVSSLTPQLEAAPRWQVAMVQPNAPCIFERDDENCEAVRQTLLRLSGQAAKSHPDLVIWPETALLGELPGDPVAMALASNGAVAAHAPLLTGAVEFQGHGQRRKDWNFYNSAWLFTPGGQPAGKYRKQHLVPFGEYIPLDRMIPLLERLSPVGFSCTPGRESTVLRIVRRGTAGTDRGDVLAFSPLICFEDLVAELGLRARKAGARLLVNITNDAWFGGSSEPEQHMAQAVFRAVESGLPLVRAANTGVTAAIDPLGRRSFLIDRQGRSSGFADQFPWLLSVPADAVETVYARYGDRLLGIPAAVFWAGFLAQAALRLRKDKAKPSR